MENRPDGESPGWRIARMENRPDGESPGWRIARKIKRPDGKFLVIFHPDVFSWIGPMRLADAQTGRPYSE
jgi:hypothetical protein